MSLAYLADIFSHLNDLNASILETPTNKITDRERYLPSRRGFTIGLKRIKPMAPEFGAPKHWE